MFVEMMRNYWLPIGTTSDVGSKPKSFRVLGESVVAYRDHIGVVIMRDACPHRGAALSNGSLTDGNLTCPYHGWQYDRTGSCVSIPSLNPCEKIPASAKTTTYHAKEAYGLVWVCMSAKEAEFPAWPDNAWEDPAYKVFCTGRYLWNANFTRVVENGLDFSHFNFAHKGLTELANGPEINPHKVETNGETLTVTYDDSHLIREFTVHFPISLHNCKRVIRVEGSATWSSNADSKLGDTTIVSLIAAPISETETCIFGFLSRNHSLDMSDAEFASGFDGVLEQDRVIVESQMPKVIPDDIGSELHVRYADIGSIAYRRMFKAARNRAAPSPTPNPQ